MRGKAAGIGLGLVLAALALLLGGTAAAQDSNKLYRWVDKNGHVHYGDQPADGTNASEVNLKALNTADSAAIDPAKAAAAQKQAATCKQKLDQYTQYQQATSISETDSLGNEHQYTADEKTQLIAKTQKYLDDNCGGVPAAAPADTSANPPATPPQ